MPVPALDADTAAEVACAAVERWRVAPGVVVGWITPDGGGVAACGRDGNGAPVTPTTVFQVGSITKTFTGALLADMVSTGDVALDTPLGALHPGLPAAAARIPLSSLATHTSGLPRMRVGLPLLAGALLHRGNPYRGMDRQRVWDDVASAPLGDDSHLYSNLGMAALGQALAERQGYSYEELLTRRVLAPLGMTDAPAFAGFSPPPGTADGHGTNLESTHAWRLEGFAPAGGLHANGEAMQRYLRANLAGTAPGGTLALEPRVFPEDGRGVGLAWMVFERRGRTVTGHNGGTGGFRSFIGFDRSAGEGVFVLANSGNSADRVGASLLHTAAAPKPPRAGVLAPVVAVLLAAWGALATAGARAPRLDRLIGDRADALRRLVLVVCVLAFSWESVDLRAWPPAVVVGVAALTIGLHAAALARSRPAAPRPLAARLWQGLVLVMVLWAALVSPRVG